MTSVVTVNTGRTRERDGLRHIWVRMYDRHMLMAAGYTRAGGKREGGNDAGIRQRVRLTIDYIRQHS